MYLLASHVSAAIIQISSQLPVLTFYFADNSADAMHPRNNRSSTVGTLEDGEPIHSGQHELIKLASLLEKVALRPASISREIAY